MSALGSLPSSTKRLIQVTHDSAVSFVSLPIALVVLFGIDGLYDFEETMAFATPVFTIVATACFILFRLYRGLWRFASLADLYAIVGSVGSAVLIFAPLMTFIDAEKPIPPAAFFIQFLSLIVFLGGSRCLRRLYSERRVWCRSALALTNSIDRISLLVVGDIKGVELIIRACQYRTEDTPYRVAGIVELAGGHVGREILSVPILGTIAQMRDILGGMERKGQRPQRIVLSTPLRGQSLRDLQAIAEEAKVPLCRLPKPTEFREAIKEEDSTLDLQPIAIKDLLNRPQIELETPAIESLIKKRRVLVTGAGGSIGSELCRQIARYQPAELILIDYCEYNLYAIDTEFSMQVHVPLPRVPILVDIRDARALDRVFRHHRPDLVFHAAALKHVPLVEENAIEGVRTNVFGTRNVADAARRNGALAFVQVSTDKAVAPTNVMGATKRLAEFYCQALDRAAAAQLSTSRATTFKTVRFGNVIGSSGSVVPLFQQQLRKGGPITVTHPDITRYFMTISEAAGLVMQALAASLNHVDHRGEIYVLDMGSPVRILDLAAQMINLTGLEDVPIEIIGLRPGEKLYEELFDSREEKVPSGIAGILIARSKPMTMTMLRAAFEELKFACERCDENAAIRMLARYVPGYTPDRVFDACRPIQFPVGGIVKGCRSSGLR